jgi:hypothetical protein
LWRQTRFQFGAFRFVSYFTFFLAEMKKRSHLTVAMAVMLGIVEVAVGDLLCRTELSIVRVTPVSTYINNLVDGANGGTWLRTPT